MNNVKGGKTDLSIIVPVFNHEQYISRCFDSILGQKTGFVYEIIVGDDGSKDRSKEIIEEYIDRYPDTFIGIIREKNLGATNNLYELLKKSRGRYVAVCEGDDYWCDHSRIERDVQWLDENLGYIGICGKTIPISENGRELFEEDIPPKERFWCYEKDRFTIKEFADWQMPGHISALTFRNFLHSDYKDCQLIKEAHPVVADRTLILMAVLRGDIKCIKSLVSCYRFRITENGTNFMSDFKRKNLRYEDYRMMCVFEKYAQEGFGRQLDLGHIKAERFIGSVLVWIGDRSRCNWEVVRRIVLESGHPFRCMYYIGTIIVKKKVMQLAGKEKRIESGRYHI